VVLHALEDDQTISRRLDLVVENLEALPHPKGLDLSFDQALG
jgi:hypothetical protein